MTITEETITLNQRILDSAIHAMELQSIHIGRALGLYDVIDAAGTVGVEDLAAKAGIHVRYATEWLEQQAVAGFLVVDDELRFSIPAEHRGALVDETALDHLSPLASMVAGIGKVIDDLVAAYRTGDGVPYAR